MTYAKCFLFTVSFFCLSANAGDFPIQNSEAKSTGILTKQDLEAKCAGKPGIFKTIVALLGLSSKNNSSRPRVRPGYLDVS